MLVLLPYFALPILDFKLNLQLWILVKNNNTFLLFDVIMLIRGFNNKKCLHDT